ncbi:hypothetical protein Q4498_17940, partial [Neptunomonas phycophila]|uniref:hypothetical protein n=1 Tax=Neptunomonas phycophila TaxID=1572645 RepID=UPI0026E30B07
QHGTSSINQKVACLLVMTSLQVFVCKLRSFCQGSSMSCCLGFIDVDDLLHRYFSTLNDLIHTSLSVTGVFVA